MKQNKNIIFIMAALLMMSYGSEAFAAGGPSFFTPTPGDLSISKILQPIFGSLFGGASGSGPFAAMLGIFNGSAMTIGGLLLAYTFVAGTMQTAHDGEMLGKKWSSMWLPIRTALGVGMTVPMAGGFCVAQLLVGYLATQGIGLADKLWDGFTHSAFTSSNLAPKTTLPEVSTIAQQLLKNMVCMASGNALIQSDPSSKNINSLPYAAQDYSTPGYTPTAADYSVEPLATPITIPADHGRNYGKNGDNECGSVHFAYSFEQNLSPSAFASILSTKAERDTAAQAIVTAHQAALVSMEAPLGTLATQIITPNSTPDYTLLQKASDSYTQNLAASLSGVFGQGDQLLDPIKATSSSDGWIMAGAWFMKIAQLQDAMHSAAAAVPSVKQPSSSTKFKDAFSSYEGFIKNIPGADGFLAQTQKEDDGWHLFDGGDPLNKATKKMSQWVAKKLQLDPSRHPVMAAKDFGDVMMGFAEVGMGIAIVVNFGSSIVGSVIMALTLPSFAMGAMLSIYTPVIPFIVFFGTALGWILLVCEAVVAAPLWAVMHLTPNGDDLMGGARQGYMLMLGLLLRPSLIIFGYAISIVIMEPVLGFFNTLFFPVLFSSMGDSISGLFTLIIGFAIYITTFIFFMHKIMGLTHVIPDQLLQWIGGPGSQLGQMGGGALEAGKSGKAAMANAAGQFGQSLNMAAQNAANQARSDKLARQGQNEKAGAAIQGKADNSTSGLQNDLAATSSANDAQSAAEATGSPSAQAKSVAENAVAHGALSERAEGLESAKGAAESRLQALDKMSNKDMPKEQRDREKAGLTQSLGKIAEQQSQLQGPMNLAQQNAGKALGALTGASDQAAQKAQSGELSSEEKETAIQGTKAAMSAARGLMAANPQLAESLGAEQALGKLQNNLSTIESSETKPKASASNSVSNKNQQDI